MKNKLLLPRICRPIGWVLFPLAIINLASRYVYDYKYQLPILYKRIILPDGSNTFAYEFTENFAWIFTLFTLFMIAFSRQKVEDEYVQSIRLNSLLLSIYLYAAAFILVMFLAESSFFPFAIINIIPQVLIFILVFNFRMFIMPRFSKSQSS